MDKSLKCVECGAEFVFTEGEQEFYASQGFTSEPRRCPSCRAARKAGQGGSKAPRNNSGAENSAAAANTRPPRQMYSAVCAECGKETQVPFQPTNGRPVYCSDCYHANNGGASRSGGSRSYGNNNSRPSAPRSNNNYTTSASSFDADFDMSSLVDMYPPPSSGGRRNNKRDRRNKDRDYDSWR